MSILDCFQVGEKRLFSVEKFQTCRNFDAARQGWQWLGSFESDRSHAGFSGYAVFLGRTRSPRSIAQTSAIEADVLSVPAPCAKSPQKKCWTGRCLEAPVINRRPHLCLRPAAFTTAHLVRNRCPEVIFRSPKQQVSIRRPTLASGFNFSPATQKLNSASNRLAGPLIF